jgi:hypothetical protein
LKQEAISGLKQKRNVILRAKRKGTLSSELKEKKRYLRAKRKGTLSSELKGKERYPQS